MNLVRTDLCSREECNSDFAGVMYITIGFGSLDTISHLQLTDLGEEQFHLGAMHKHICGYSVVQFCLKNHKN